MELRKQSAQELVNIGFDGYAIGGLSVGEPFVEACAVLDETIPQIPVDTPRYFMGGAQPHEIVGYVQRGIDMLDCVLPTRNARHGQLYRFRHDDLTQRDFYETIHVTNERFSASDESLFQGLGMDDVEAVDEELKRYSLGYVRHLFRVDEMLGMRLASLWNVRFYLSLMKKIRKGIEAGTV